MRKIFAFFMSVLIFSAMPLFCQEEKESEKVMSLKEIDQLIRDENARDYQKALLELNKYFAANPSEFDAVQSRITKIMNSRTLYTDYANELLNIIRNGQEGHNEELKEITDRLLTLERNPGDPRLDVIKDMNYLMNMYQYSAVQNKTGELVASRKWNEAASKALEGFVPLKENFAVKNRGLQVINEVSQHQSKVASLVEQFNLLTEKTLSSVSAYENAVRADNDQDALAAWNSVKADFESIAAVRSALVQEADYFNRLGEKQVPGKNTRTGDEQQDLYLKHADEYPFLSADCILGWRNNQDYSHGILGSIDTFYCTYLEEMKALTAAAINTNAAEFSDSSSVQTFRENGTMPDNTDLKKIMNYADCGVGLNSLYSKLGAVDRRPEKSYPNYSISVRYVSDVAKYTMGLVDSVVEIAGYLQKGMAVAEPENQYEQEMKGSAFADAVLQNSSKITAAAGKLNTNLNRKTTWGADYQKILEKSRKTGSSSEIENTAAAGKAASDTSAVSKVSGRSASASSAAEKALTGTAASPASVSGHTASLSSDSSVASGDSVILWDKIEKTLDDYIGAIDDYAKESAVSLYVKVARYYAKIGVNFVEKAEKDNDNLASYVNGTASETGRKYPEKTISLISELNVFIANSKNILQKGQKTLDSSYSSRYRDSSASIASSISKLDEITRHAAVSGSTARKLIKDSENAKKKAEDYLAEAQKALKNQNFDRATELTNKANDYFNEALKNSYSDSLSKSASEKVLAVLTSIGEKQKMIISDEVDALIVQASKEYENNNYSRAQTMLSKAQERWNLVFSDIQNEEIYSMTEVVKQALSMNTGREVLPGDPLYKEVSNILNLANQNYEKALSYTKKGRTEDAATQFAEALSRLEELRAIVPYNKDANLLRLKIQQIQDPEEFNRRFAERVESAKQEYKQKEKQLQAYNDLSDLAQINPDYPGLKNLIEEIEYETGRKKRPVQVSADRQQAVTLTAQARKLYNSAGTDQTKLKQALALAGQALVKDSTNQEARKLQSQIRSKIQVKAKVSSFEINERYNEALEKFNNGDIYGAAEVINALWKDASSRTEKIERLKKRIEARL